MVAASARLREKQRQMEQFIDVALDLQCVADTKGRLRQFNPVWRELLAAPLETLEGTRLIDLVHQDDKATTEQALAESEHFLRSLIDIIPGMVSY